MIFVCLFTRLWSASQRKDVLSRQESLASIRAWVWSPIYTHPTPYLATCRHHTAIDRSDHVKTLSCSHQPWTGVKTVKCLSVFSQWCSCQWSKISAIFSAKFLRITIFHAPKHQTRYTTYCYILAMQNSINCRVCIFQISSYILETISFSLNAVCYSWIIRPLASKQINQRVRICFNSYDRVFGFGPTTLVVHLWVLVWHIHSKLFSSQLHMSNKEQQRIEHTRWSDESFPKPTVTPWGLR